MTGLAIVSLAAASTIPAVSAAWADVRVPNAPNAANGGAHGSKAQVNHFGTALWSVRGMGPVWMSSPVIATIDGVKAVVLGTLSGEIYVLNAKTGAELPGWPEFVHINSPTPTAIDSSPAVAYLDGPDRPPSIIVGAGSMWRRDQQGGLEAFYASGRVRFVFQDAADLQPVGRPQRLFGPGIRHAGRRRHNGNGSTRHRLRFVRPLHLRAAAKRAPRAGLSSQPR